METKEKDLILEMFFEPARWENAISKGIEKDIRRSDLQKLATPEFRVQLYRAIKSGNYEIAPPHTAQIPKDTPGEFRIVYVNEPIDRAFLSIANDLLFELTPDRIHPSCKSYQKGISCGKVVQDIARYISETKAKTPGFKSDLSKYFDKVPLRYADEAFDMVEARYGHSAIIDVLRKYYHSAYYFDDDNILRDKFDECECGQSLKQGCAVASWLADVILYDVDEIMTANTDLYRRYCDDMLVLDKNPERALQLLKDELRKKGIVINDKKTEYLSHDKWFKFLGFSIKGEKISISRTRLKKFQKEIESRTVKKRGTTLAKAVNSVNSYLYRGDGEHSWADQILSVCNVASDIDELNKFVMDCLRAVMTGKGKVGGLGFDVTGKNGCVVRGIGRNVKANRLKTDAEIAGFLTLGTMRNARVMNRQLYKTLVRSL